jgi:hypothetical protein
MLNELPLYVLIPGGLLLAAFVVYFWLRVGEFMDGGW